MIHTTLAAITGLLLLLAGRRLFWLAFGMLAFLLSWDLVTGFFGQGWRVLGLSLLLSLFAAWLALKFIRWSALLFGMLAGAFALPLLVTALGLDFSWYLAAAIGGAAGLLLVSLTLNWGLVLLTAFVGASDLAAGAHTAASLEAAVTNILFLLLLLLGVAWQGAQLRSRR